MLRELIQVFRDAVSGADETIDLAEAALLVAQAEYSSLDHAKYRHQLDGMGQEAARNFRGGHLDRILQLNALLFGRWGFRGNHQNYYDPRNSFLNEVLDRRLGIPITLSLVYIEVGHRAGLDLVGVGMPGHFLVGLPGRTDLYVDTFTGGNLMTSADCVARLRELRPDLVFRPDYLDPVSHRQILTRMLNNLLQIYRGSSQFSKALTMLEMIFCLEPEEPEWLRQRATVHYQLKNYSQAIADLETYLERAPNALDYADIVEQLSALRHLRGMVN